MTPLICEESWLNWPAKHWSECFSYEITEVFPNWIISLATGDATIGSYLIAAVVGFLGLAVLGIIIAVIADWIEEHPRVKWWIKNGLINLPGALLLGLAIHFFKSNKSADGVAAIILVALYYACVGLFIGFNRLGKWLEKRRAEKR